MEFFEDYFESHPDAAIRKEVHEATGQVYFATGDALVDRWEREIAEGREPDYDEALTPEQREHETARRRAASEREAFEGLEERFDVATR